MALSTRLLTLMGLLLFLPFLAGCGSGKKAIAQAHPPLIENLDFQVNSDDVEVDFGITDPTEGTWIANLFFSEDLGENWIPISVPSLADPELVLSPPFLPVKTLWYFRSDLSTIPQADVLLEIRISNEEGEVVTSVRSNILVIGESEAPVFMSLDVPSGPVGGEVVISGSVLDPDADHVFMHLEWSPTGSAPWTLGTLLESPLIIPPDQEGKASAFTLNWNAQDDAPNLISPFAKIRLVASDGGASTIFVSNYIALNTVPPGIDLMTIGRVPLELNGSQPYSGSGNNLVPFSLSIPQSGSRIRIEWGSGNGGALINPNSLELIADQTVLNYLPGENLADLFVSDDQGAEWTLSESQSLPTGLLTLTATVQDIRGNVSNSAIYSVEVRSGSAAYRPFEAEDRWFLDFSRDHFQIGLLDEGNGEIAPFASYGGDGIADHRQDLFTVGLQSSVTDGPHALQDAIVRAWVESETLERIKILFAKTENEDLQPQLTFQTHGGGSTSALGIGGDDVEPLSYALGRAVFDARNEQYDDEREPGRGVFSSNMVQYYWNSYTFNQRFSGVLPTTGTPVGAHSLDNLVLSSGFVRTHPSNSPEANSRHDEIWDAIEAWSRLISVVAAHEIGHALGLCSNGHPPFGLFGGVTSADFTGPFTTPYHVDTPGNNVMSSALGLSSALVEGPHGYRFNELNQAYIAEWIVLEE